MTEENKIIIELHKPGKKELFFFFVSGVIVSVPITLNAGTFSNHLCVLVPILSSVICSTTLMAPFIEEFAKAFPLFYRHGETERSLLTLGLMVGLGFGVTELFFYVFGSGESIHARLPGMFFHAASTAITAYGIAIKRPMPFYLIASLLHLLNNILATNSSYWFPVGPMVLITTYFISLHLYNITREEMVA